MIESMARSLPYATLRQVFAGALLVLGLVVLAGWALHIALLVQAVPGQSPMTISTALCFVVAGLALLPSSMGDPGSRRRQQVIGVLIATVAIAMMVANVADLELGLDFADLQSWLPGNQLHPGRMSLNTTIGFALAGLCLTALQAERRGVWAGALNIPAAATVLIGVVALLGYAFGTEYISQWHGYTSMAIHSAIGMVVLGGALLFAVREVQSRREWSAARPADRIAAIAAAWLTVVALVAGVLGFIVMQREAERTIDRTLSMALRNMTQVFSSLLDVRASEAARIAGRPFLIESLRRLVEDPADARATAVIAATTATVVSGGVDGVVIYDQTGAEISRAGRFTEDPEMVVPIATGHATELLWKDQFVLRSYLLFRDASGFVGSGVVEQSLPVLTRTVFNAGELGQTGDAGVCVARPATLLCFPTRLNRAVFTLSNTDDEPPRPIALALQGKVGVIRRTDYRGEQVVAAYGPIGTTGLGAAIKIDREEIYQPVRERLLAFIPVLLVVVAIGAFALRLQVNPLASALVDSREALKARSEQLAQSNDELLRALATKDRFFATMSHELRTPLNAILGFTQVLLMRLPGPLTAEQAKQLGIVDSSGRHLLSLISGLLDGAAVDAGRVELAPEPLVAQDLVDDVIAVLRQSAEAKGLVLRSKQPPRPVTLNVDKRAVFQILINLTNNAVKYTNSGSVTLNAERDEASATTRFVVTDTGIGIRDVDRQRLFKAFARLEQSAAQVEGVGLGLHYSQQLAHLLGGEIQWTSTFGSGSCFVLTVPDRDEDKPPPVAASERTAPEPR